MTVRNLWAPWRMEYVTGEREAGCPFCLARDQADDPQRLVVGQNETAVAILNRFPYTGGHLLIVPKRHVADMEDLDERESADLWVLTTRAKQALDCVMGPDGYNVGLNLGKAAGAGIGQHLHLHLVPRWTGDTNFMPVLGEAQVIPEHLANTHAALKAQFDT